MYTLTAYVVGVGATVYVLVDPVGAVVAFAVAFTVSVSVVAVFFVCVVAVVVAAVAAAFGCWTLML